MYLKVSNLQKTCTSSKKLDLKIASDFHFRNIIVTNVIVPRLFTKTILQELPAETSDKNFENIKIGIIMKCWRNRYVKQA